MTLEDTENLWELLGIFRKSDQRLQDKKLRSAWQLVLEPYSPEDVRKAVAAYFRRCKYWPDVTDIAALCPKLESDEPEMVKEIRPPCGNFSVSEISKCNAQLDEMLELGELMERDYIAAGIPHPNEARNMGWSCRDWIDRFLEKFGGKQYGQA